MVRPEIVEAESGKYLDSKRVCDYLARIAGERANGRNLEQTGIVSNLGRSVIYRGRRGKVVVHYTTLPLLGKMPDKLTYIPRRL